MSRTFPEWITWKTETRIPKKSRPKDRYDFLISLKFKPGKITQEISDNLDDWDATYIRQAGELASNHKRFTPSQILAILQQHFASELAEITE